MKFQRYTLLFSILVLLIIIFDAVQQQYYLETFDLQGENTQVQLLTLVQTHAIRWLVWALYSIPLGLYAWKVFSNTNLEIPTSKWIKISAVGLIGWFAAIASISILSFVGFESELSLSNYFESFTFFIFQKGLNYTLASLLLVLTLYNNSKDYVIEAQWIELSNLKSNKSQIQDINDDPQVTIKIGNKLKLIPVNEITWIEADDYCVKIHTASKSYSMRKSMKSLEVQLASYRFIRVHRGALLNFGYLDHVDFESSTIKLQDSSELPLSKSGAQVLREALKASSI